MERRHQFNSLNRVSREIGQRGVLDVLRKGIKDRGCHFNLTYFRPSSGMNPDHQELYAQNPLLLNSAVEVFREERKVS